MSKKKSPFKEPWRYMTRGRKKTPQQTLESYLVRLDKLDVACFSFWEDYWNFLARERERLLDDITDALFQSRVENQRFTEYSRIVSAEYSQNPLCTKGSVVCPPGGRFNFGSISSTLQNFHSLYIASDFDTAFAEKYLIRNDDSIADGNLAPEDLKFQKPGSHLHCRVNVELDSVLDLRDEQSLAEFVKVISEINPPEDLVVRAQVLNLGALRTVQDVPSLLKSIFENNFTQWGIWIDQPSNSQWLGHYSRLAGLNGIIYPSQRHPEGHNIAIFPDTFSDSDCFVELSDKVEHMDEDKTVMNKDNYTFFRGDQDNNTLH
jgi:hypothetical protein